MAEKKAKKEEKGQVAEKTGKKTPAKKKSKGFLRIRALLKRKRLPSFRGRFGKECIRRPSIEKWQRWRKPRGEDISRNQEDGARPDSGYRTPKEIRFLHPSGYRETLVRNQEELANAKDCVARIAASVGKKKRKQIIAEAKKQGIRLLN